MKIPMKNKFKGENNIHISTKNWFKAFAAYLGVLGLVFLVTNTFVSFPHVCLFIAGTISLGMFVYVTASAFEFHDRQRRRRKTRGIRWYI